MKNKNNSEIFFDQQSLKCMMEGQHLMNRKIKIKGSPLSKDLDQVEVTTERAEENHSQNNRVEQPRKDKSKAPTRIATQNYSHQDNSWQEGGAESEYTEARTHDRFSCFANILASIRLPHKFKPSNHSKYDGKTKPK